MVRKQVYIEPEQEEKLKDLSERLGVSEAELIRRGVDLITRDDEDLDRKAAWQQVLAMIEERARRFPKGGSTVKFNRDELYDDRPRYLSR
jgi:hypothetical protein